MAAATATIVQRLPQNQSRASPSGAFGLARRRVGEPADEQRGGVFLVVGLPEPVEAEEIALERDPLAEAPASGQGGRHVLENRTHGYFRSSWSSCTNQTS